MDTNLQVMVGRIDERTLAIDSKLDDFIVEVRGRLKDQDKRIDKTSGFRNKLTGGLLAVSTAAGWAVAWFSRKH